MRIFEKIIFYKIFVHQKILFFCEIENIFIHDLMPLSSRFYALFKKFVTISLCRYYCNNSLLIHFSVFFLSLRSNGMQLTLLYGPRTTTKEENKISKAQKEMNNANVFLLLQHFIVFSIPCL
jgi:hypothetical protein